jgi:hypothetical protein
MNVLLVVATVTLMLTVPILLEASPVHARVGIREMESLECTGKNSIVVFSAVILGVGLLRHTLCMCYSQVVPINPY